MGAQPSEFRTKTGVCVVDGERILLTRTGVRGAASQALVGDSVSRLVITYGTIAIGSIIAGVWNFVSHREVAGALLCGYGALLISLAVRSRRLSAAADIRLSDVKAIVAHRPRPPLTRGYFEVEFQQDGRSAKRIVMLPGSLSGGAAEFERALTIFKTTQRLKDTP